MPPQGNYFIREIALKNRAMLEVDEALNLYYLLMESCVFDGDVVELGCYRGLTGVILQKTLEQYAPEKQLYLFDSFEGLPEKQEPDRLLEQSSKHIVSDNRRIGKGWFSTSYESVIESFALFDTPLPHIVKGWFSETLPSNLPEKICFAHLDGDFYSSIFDSLEGIYDRLSPGGIVVIDDYCDNKFHERPNAYPGVKKACDAFLKDKPETVQLIASRNGYQGFFVKETPS